MSDILIKRLTFDNMYSYGAANEMILDASTITQLRAINGYGKTSIALILQEILFNKNFRNVKKGDILNRVNGSKTWSGKLEFLVRGVEYSIAVTRTGAATKVKLIEAGKDISEHKVIDTYKKVHDILGMNFDTFSQLTYQSSTDLLDFLKATDANRKKFLIKLFNLEKYTDIGDRIKLIASATDKEMGVLQTEANTVASFLNSVSITDMQFEVVEPEVDAELSVRRAQLLSELKNINDTCLRIDKNNMAMQERDDLRFDPGMTKPTPFEFMEQMQALRFNLTSLAGNVNKYKTEKVSIKIRDTCSSCGQAIDNTHLSKMRDELDTKIFDTEELINTEAERYKVWEQQFNEIKIEEKAYNINDTAIKRFEQLSQVIDESIPTDYPNATEIEAESKQLAAQIKTQNELRKSAVTFNKDVSAHNSKREALIEQKSEFTIRQNSIANDILIKSGLINSDNTLKKAFSASGIVAFKLENLTKELETTINYYLAIMSDGQFQVEFTLTNEKLNIFIINNGYKSPVETVSGGEFSRIQISILLAIRKLLSKLGGSSINLLFLDEITGVLDAEGKEKLIEVLLQETDLNVFLITHEFNHPLVDKIEIIKENNISSIAR